MTFPWCQYKTGTAPATGRPCRAVPTFEVAETAVSSYAGVTFERGWFGIGDYCTGHAITVCAAKPTRAMRPLPATVEVHGKH